MCEYRSSFGDCNVPQKYFKNTKLHRWISKQKQLKKEGKLNVDRVQKLEKIGFSGIPMMIYGIRDTKSYVNSNPFLVIAMCLRHIQTIQNYLHGYQRRGSKKIKVN